MKLNMLNRQKWSLAASILLIAVCLNSCKDSFLDTDPQGQQPSEDFWASESDATKAVNAAYANLRSWNNVAFAALAVESIGSDEAEKGSTAADASYLNEYDNFKVTVSQNQLEGFWGAQYENINLANQVLDSVPSISMDENLKARYLGEVKFIRAYSYFRLLRVFGGVPLRLSVPQDPATEYNIPRNSKAEVYAAIEQDLTDAAAVLPQSYDSENLGRATKGAALALLAKVGMYQQKWDKVFEYTNQVMQLGYSLVSDYEKLFRLQNENSGESVFEIQCALVSGNTDASNSQYSQVQGVKGSTGGGWGFNVPTTELVNAYEAGDPRKDATIIFRGETTPEGDVIPSAGDNPRFNQKSYVPFNLYVSGYNEGCQQNIRVLRYAEVLLMNAEAANELGNTSQALSSLELVRARARGSNSTILPKITITEQTGLRNAIWNERRVELAMESDRYFDVIRQGRAAEVFGPKGWTEGVHEVWPIPQNEIDRSGGLLTQNPGY